MSFSTFFVFSYRAAFLVYKKQGFARTDCTCLFDTNPLRPWWSPCLKGSEFEGLTRHCFWNVFRLVSFSPALSCRSAFPPEKSASPRFPYLLFSRHLVFTALLLDPSHLNRTVFFPSNWNCSLEQLLNTVYLTHLSCDLSCYFLYLLDSSISTDSPDMYIQNLSTSSIVDSEAEENNLRQILSEIMTDGW